MLMDEEDRGFLKRTWETTSPKIKAGFILAAAAFISSYSYKRYEKRKCRKVEPEFKEAQERITGKIVSAGEEMKAAWSRAEVAMQERDMVRRKYFRE